MRRETGGELPRPLQPALALLGAAGLTLALVELVLFLEGPAVPKDVIALFPIGAAMFFAAGIVAWARRPANRTGALLYAGGLVHLVAGLVNTPFEALVAAGQIVATVILAVVVHVLLAFPSGRLRGRSDRLLTAAAYFISLVLQAPLYLFAPAAGSPLTIEPDITLAETALDVQNAVGGLLMLTVIGVLIARLRAAPAPQRRTLAPVYFLGMLVALGVPLTGNVLAGTITLATIQLVSIALVPLAFVVGVLRGGFARTAELDELSRWLGSGEGGTVGALAAALGDPTVELAYWSEPGGRFVGADGTPAELPAVGSGRAAVEVEVDGRRVGAIAYDATAIAEPETVRAAGRVVALAVEHERLRHEIAAAGDSARRSIAQDLHDGLQSRLVLLAMQADLAGERELREGLETAVAELRELVQGAMPAVLTERGLFRATETLTRGLPLPVALTLAGNADELPDAVQSEAYFVVAEALTNAVKHSGARELAVRLEVVDGRLELEIRDDGTGGTQPGAGAGLRSMAERLERVGGRFSVESASGDGTRVLAEIPCV